jgi:hypothetical protein
MKSIGRTKYLAALTIFVVVIAALLTVCDDRSTDQDDQAKAEAQRQSQLQLRAEQALRMEAEKSAQASESSRNVWIVGLVVGVGLCSLIALLVGVHIGSRARERSRKEHADG